MKEFNFLICVELYINLFTLIPTRLFSLIQSFTVAFPQTDMRPRHLLLTFVCLTHLEHSLSKSVLTDNGYMNLVVGISPDVPESQETIDNIKHLLTEASRELFIATRNRAYFKQVKILLPKTWSMAYDQDLEGEIYEDAEVRVDRPNPVYADAPYTVRGAECGDPGSYIHFTPGNLDG